MIYVACKYAPIELLEGFGTEVQRLDPVPRNLNCGHANLCTFARAMLQEVEEKQIQELVLTDCCDAQRRVFDELKAADKLKFLYFLSLPHTNSDQDIERFAKDLRKLAEAYTCYSGKILNQQKVKELCRQDSQKEPLPKQPYLMLDGAHGGKALLEQVRHVFPDVPIVNITCSGYRVLNQEKETADFYTWYADTLLNQERPCMRMYRGARGGAGDENCIGILFHTIKFCDYYGFAYMNTRDMETLPQLKLETDTTPSGSGQSRTRLEAFREELGLKKPERTISGEHLFVAGIDSGSTSTDAVILNEKKEILGKAIVDTGADIKKAASLALQEACKQAGIQPEQLNKIISTGYGRAAIEQDNVTEITCHAIGAHFLNPDIRTVIDIGGQDSKVIRIDETGKVIGFVMNDKCAAGTGRFLTAQAKVLQLSMDEMSEQGMHWQNNVTLSSVCTVFAESEVISLLAKNREVPDIIHGLNMAVAKKTALLAKRAGAKGPYCLTGGVANNQGVIKCLEECLQEPLYVPTDTQLCGAIGAALSCLSPSHSA